MNDQVKPWYCTMKANTHITGTGKWPKLEEALKHFCGRELGDFAHDAMYDVKACRDIFFASFDKNDLQTYENLLFIDTETTGFPKGNGITEGQARVCQVAMLLTDNKGKSLLEFSGLIKPDGWKVDAGAQKVHGFSTEQCEQLGMNFRAIVNLYNFAVSKASLLVAHNSDFDKKMMDIETAYAKAAAEPRANPGVAA